MTQFWLLRHLKPAAIYLLCKPLTYKAENKYNTNNTAIWITTIFKYFFFMTQDLLSMLRVYVNRPPRRGTLPVKIIYFFTHSTISNQRKRSGPAMRLSALIIKVYFFFLLNSYISPCTTILFFVLWYYNPLNNRVHCLCINFDNIYTG